MCLKWSVLGLKTTKFLVYWVVHMGHLIFWGNQYLFTFSIILDYNYKIKAVVEWRSKSEHLCNICIPFLT